MTAWERFRHPLWKLQPRPGGAWETSRKRGLYRRLTLRRADGQVYLNRWGFGHDRIGGILLHRMDAPDPGADLHDHPWWFVSIILWGGYTEFRTLTAFASIRARAVERDPFGAALAGAVVHRRWLSIKTMALDECHSVVGLRRKHSWSLVIKGPRRRDRDDESSTWGFYLPGGWMPEDLYDATVRADRRDLWSDQNQERPW